MFRFFMIQQTAIPVLPVDVGAEISAASSGCRF
jgi:hypothetical protein